MRLLGTDPHESFVMRAIRWIVVFAVGVLAAATADAQQVTKELSAARSFFALPMEVDRDFGAANGDALIMRIQPLYKVSLGKKWELVNLNIITLADAPGGTPAFPSATAAKGVSDLFHASFFTPKHNNDFVWGVGPVFTLPTATDVALGSDKWTGGIGGRFAYRVGGWNLGLVATQRWSFAGSGNKPDVNQFLARGAFRYSFSDKWYFVSSPIIVANWDADDKWLVPVGGGIGRSFTHNGHPWAWSVQGYVNAIKPDPAPDWVVRFQLVAAIPYGD